MPLPLAVTYRDAHRRVDTRVRALVADGPEPSAVDIPGCPGWTAHDLVSHLAGIAADALAGELTGIPSDEHTGRQVAQRRDRPTLDVLDEWAALVDPLASAVEQHGIVSAAVDVLTHDGDLREALGEAPPPEDEWRVVVRAVCKSRIRDLGAPGTLTVSTGADTFTGGSGEDGPGTTLHVAPWELFRGAMSRRSTAQIRSWAWDGDPDPWLDGFAMFGLRDDDQPVPA